MSKYLTVEKQVDVGRNEISFVVRGESGEWSSQRVRVGMMRGAKCQCGECRFCEATLAIHLYNALDNLGRALTGKDATGARPRLSLWEFWYGDMFYLPDGGYSRVFWDQDTGTVGLSSESRDEVKARWDKVRFERAAVESIFWSWLSKVGG